MAVLGLVLKDSKIIYYGIDETTGTAKIKAYIYHCETDAYVLNEDLNYSMQKDFFREAEKESLFQKYDQKQ